MERLESKQLVVTGDDEIGGGLKRAFQDAIIRKILKNPEPGRWFDDGCSASDESKSRCNIFFSLMKFSSKDARGFGQYRNGRKENGLSALCTEEGVFGKTTRDKEGRDKDVRVEDHLH